MPSALDALGSHLSLLARCGGAPTDRARPDGGASLYHTGREESESARARGGSLSRSLGAFAAGRSLPSHVDERLIG